MPINHIEREVRSTKLWQEKRRTGMSPPRFRLHVALDTLLDA